jgi:hypothetical protein
LSRDEALLQLSRPAVDDDTVAKEFEFVAAKLDISEQELHSYHQMPLKFYWDYRNQHQLIRMGEWVWTAMGLGRRGGAF